jgi:hypothetical protein
MKQHLSATVAAVAASACIPCLKQVVLLLQLANLHSPFIQLLLQLSEQGLILDTAAYRTGSSCCINYSTRSVLLRHKGKASMWHPFNNHQLFLLF